MSDSAPRSSRISVFLAELKRRKVFRALVGYAVVGVAVIEGVDLVQPTLRFSDRVYDFVVLLVLLGFPLVLALSWFIDITPEGLQRTADATPEQIAAHSPMRWTAGGWALVAVGTLIVLAAGYFAFLRPPRASVADPAGHLVAVLPLENQTGVPDLDRLGHQATSYIIDGLMRAERIRVVPVRGVYAFEAEGDGTEADSGSVRQPWAKELSATLAVMGHYFAAGDSVQFWLEIHDSLGTVLETIDPVAAPMESPSMTLDELQWRAASAVASVVTPGDPLARVNLHSRLPATEALNLYLEGLQVKGLEGSRASIPHFLAAVAKDPDYFAPFIQLIWESYNTGQRQMGDSLCALARARVDEMNRFERIDMEGGCALLRHDYRTSLDYARRMLEFLPNSIGDVGISLLALNRPQGAVEAFRARDPHASEEAWKWTPAIWRRLGQAYHLLGRYGEELEVARDLQEFFPDDPEERGYEVAIPAMAALGRLEELEALVEDRNLKGRPGTEPHWFSMAASELEVHGHPEAAHEFWERTVRFLRSRPDPLETSPASPWHHWYAGQAHLALDQAEEARPRFEGCVRTLPLYCVAGLGIVEAKLGNRHAAEELAQRLAEWDDRYMFGWNTLFRAGIRAYLGDLDVAVELLEQTVAEGYNDWMFLHRTQFLKPLWGYPPFEEFLRPKG
jgi:tetratricopeptide (TPR) repeat protein